MDKLKSLSELEIQNWVCHKVSNDVTLYLNRYKDTVGFDFYCVNNCGESYSEDKKIELYEVWFEGVVYWDGLRHFYLGSEKTDNFGYLYYLDLNKFQPAISKLNDLIYEVCPEHADLPPKLETENNAMEQQWQTMDTAPKDGTRIDLWYGHKSWQEADSWRSRQADVWWSKEHDCFVIERFEGTEWPVCEGATYWRYILGPQKTEDK